MAKVTAETIRQMVCAHYGVSSREINGGGQNRIATKARHVSFYLTRKYCGHLSYATIGRFYGGRDHTTVMAGASNVDASEQEVAELEGMIVAFENGCENIVSGLVKRSIQAHRLAVQIALLSDELSRLEAGEEMKDAA